jgi:ABC-type Zn uptake system ZnuABC Zn-binding protein ZnuA
VRKLHGADLLVRVGMELEVGWLPVLLRQARNAAIRPGGRAHLDASTAIVPLEVPVASVDRSMGDVHRFGNPHYLTDPLNGLRVARALREKLTELRPEAAAGFAAGYEAFAARLVAELVGDGLVERHGAEPLAARLAAGDLEAFLEERGEAGSLGGWLGATRGLRGLRVVQDHRMWPYFARRFGLVLADTLEPKPGIAPTTRHLAAVIERAEQEQVGAILTSPYFDPRHARFVGERTGARVLEMAHQPGARPGTPDYVTTVAYNVLQLQGAP